MIAKPDVHRAPANERMRLACYVGGGVVAGMLVGALLGALGGLLPDAVRAALATLAALVGLVVGAVELTGRRVPIPQLDRETPFGWHLRGALGWALRNGMAIGFGGGTRLGFWLWFAIPLGALVAGSPLLGALGWGLYAFARTAGVAGLMTLERLRGVTAVQTLAFAPTARVATSVQLVVLGATALLALGG